MQGVLHPVPPPALPNLHIALRIPFRLPRRRNLVHPQAPLVRTCRLRRSTWVQKAVERRFGGKIRFGHFLPRFRPSWPSILATLQRARDGLESLRRAYFVRVLPHSLRLAFELFL